MKDDIYYKELHASLRSYDTQLWTIPGLFFVVAGIIIENGKNTTILILGLIFLAALIILFEKTHFFNMSIQKKINKFDKKFNEKQDEKGLKRMPLTSMSDRELEERLEELIKDKESEFKLSFFQKWLIRVRISSWIRNTMLLVFTFVFIFFFFQIKGFVIDFINCLIIAK